MKKCDLCSAPVIERHCKLVCTGCGFVRDCSDPANTPHHGKREGILLR